MPLEQGRTNQKENTSTKTYEEIEQTKENNLVYIKKTRKIEITDIIEKAIPDRSKMEKQNYDHSKPSPRTEYAKSVKSDERQEISNEMFDDIITS